MEVMLLNGILYDSEVWPGVTRKQIRFLKAINKSLRFRILQAKKKKIKR